jgi:hypothetical protein
MARFLCNTELYETTLQKSKETKNILWVCSTALSLGMHRVFSQELLKNPPIDMRFILKVNESAVRDGSVNPYEIQYLQEHFKGVKIKANENFHANLYIFDDLSLITSAALTEAAFESNIEAGVLLEGSDAEQVKSFFNQNLWDTSKALGDLKKYKLLWNLSQKTSKRVTKKKVKPNIKIRDWTNAYINTWYIGVSNWVSTKTEHKVKKETTWPSNLSVLGDVGYHTFTQVNLGDFAYVANLSKRSKVEIKFAKVIDKARVETDEGDFHFAFEDQRKIMLEKDRFYEMLKAVKVNSRTSETVLNEDQLRQVETVFSSFKQKRKNKRKTKTNVS